MDKIYVVRLKKGRYELWWDQILNLYSGKKLENN